MYIPEDLQQFQGLKNLKFMNLARLQSMATGAQRSLTTNTHTAAADGLSVASSTEVRQARKHNNLASRLARAASDKILHHQESLGMESLESNSLTGTVSRTATTLAHRRHRLPPQLEYENMREITCFSTRTNMKYMKIGDEGAEALGRALQNDATVTELVLAGARITSIGVSVFAKHLPDMKALRHLDLSNNAVCDSGAAAVAAALPYCVLLEQCNLAGNRLTGAGAVQMIQAVLFSTITWLR